MKPFEWMTQAARRTLRPRVMLGRYIIAFDAALAFIFAILMLVRWALDRPACPPVSVRDGSERILMVEATCQQVGTAAGVAANVIDNLAAGLVVAVATSVLIWLTSPRHHVEEDISALEPWNIRPVLDAVLPTTRRYWFRGRSGRFLRTSVMPALGEAGRRESQVRELSLLLPDPADQPMLADYAFYRNSQPGEDGKWSDVRIRNEILATIIAAARAMNSNHFIQIELFLKSDFSLFRMDMADDQLVLTRENPQWPAILCSARSKFYASYIEEFRNESSRAKRIMLKHAHVPAKLQAADVIRIVQELQLDVRLDDEGAAQVLAAVEKPDLPYG